MFRVPLAQRTIPVMNLVIDKLSNLKLYEFVYFIMLNNIETDCLRIKIWNSHDNDMRTNNDCEG